MANDIVDKILEESEGWFQAKNGVLINIESCNVIRPRSQLKWKIPPDPWLKCNIGFFWSKHNNLGGASWMIRGSDGCVKRYSIRAFSDVMFLDEITFLNII